MEFYLTKTETVYPERGDVEVHLWGRTTDGDEIGPVVVEGFEPYFYVPEAEGGRILPREHSDLKRVEDTDTPSLFGDDLAKIVATHPGGVPGLKDQYEKTFEADVVFTNRFRVDTGVYTGVRVPSNRCRPEDIEPVEITEAPVRYCYFDIEINDDGSFPVDDGCVKHTESEIFSIVAYDSWEDEYHGFVYLPEEPERALAGVMESGKPPGELDKLHYRLNEKMMLKDFFNWVSERSPDVLLAWNIGFDAAYLVERASKVEADPAKMARGIEPEAYHNSGRGETTISGRVVYDLMEAWEAMQYSEVSSSLDNAASMELEGEQKIEHEESITEMWEDDTAGLMAYNAKDVELMVRINEAAGVMQDRKELKEAVGADFEFTIEANDFIEMLVRRKVDEWGVAAPTKTPPSSDDDGFEGAYTFPAFEGVRKNVTSIDLASLYPESMRMLNASPETFVKKVDNPKEYVKNHENVRVAPNGAVFNDEQIGLFKALVEEALELTKQAGDRRDEFDSNTPEWEYWNQVREARKRIRNAIYGVLGWVWFFLYHQPTAEAVTSIGQAAIKKAADHIDEQTEGKVIYGDTDSCYISWPDSWSMTKALQKTSEVTNLLNNRIYPEFATQFGIPKSECRWKMEMEDGSNRMFQAGKKKRYAKNIVWKEGMGFNERIVKE